MKQKPFDIFVSYSHADKTLVESVAKELRRRHICVWIDGWEMKPGDNLRDKISDGIANASFFLVVLSPSALSSRWVKYELSSGMIDEIEQGQVRVIPAIAGQAEYADLPADLRAKYCLDLRTDESKELAIEAIVDLLQPEVRRRKELMDRLRNPEDTFPSTIAFMEEYANGHRDQAIQVAALRGLAKTPGPQATLAIARRALDLWGCRGIETATNILSKRRPEGGLLVLTAILPQDGRHYSQRLDLIRSMIAGDDSGLADKLAAVSGLSIYRDRQAWSDAITLLANSSIADLWNGARLSLSVRASFGLHDRPPYPPPEQIVSAEQYAERMLPGFVHVLRTSARRYSSERDDNSVLPGPESLPSVVGEL